MNKTDEVDEWATTSAAAEVVVRNAQGMHLRPATEFARLARESGCDVRVRCRGQEANGASVLELVMMAVGAGSLLEIRATGEGCEAAVNTLVALVGRDFQS